MEEVEEILSITKMGLGSIGMEMVEFLQSHQGHASAAPWSSSSPSSSLLNPLKVARFSLKALGSPEPMWSEQVHLLPSKYQYFSWKATVWSPQLDSKTWRDRTLQTSTLLLAVLLALSLSPFQSNHPHFPGGGVWFKGIKGGV